MAILMPLSKQALRIKLGQAEQTSAVLIKFVLIKDPLLLQHGPAL